MQVTPDAPIASGSGSASKNPAGISVGIDTIARFRQTTFGRTL